jgi:hypothetical protein
VIAYPHDTPMDDAALDGPHLLLQTRTEECARIVVAFNGEIRRSQSHHMHTPVARWRKMFCTARITRIRCHRL